MTPARPSLSAAVAAVALASPAIARADAATAAGAVRDATAEERLGVRFQTTIATQWHGAFPARYSGSNSLPAESESATSVVTDLSLGARLWRGMEAWLEPELAGGRGVGSTLGVAAFPSGEVYRVADPEPAIILARAFVRQVVGLGGGRARVEAGPHQLGGARDRDALALTAGKLATTDVLDSNPWSSDPHTRFTSWGLWASAAYDYPADVRGYTFGVAADLALDRWSIRGGLFLEPTTANGGTLDWRLDRSRGWAVEGERRFDLGGWAGAVRALAFVNVAGMGSYRRALDASPSAPDVVATREPGRAKWGFAASANQELGDGLGAFLRLSWNDGATESWAFTEIDRSVAAGAVQAGAPWGRPDDEAGAAIVVSALSGPHRAYLAAGGQGFLLGDGALRYGPEILAEAFYRLALGKETSFAAVYQAIVNPAFNRDRGPAHVLTGRLHVAF